MGHSETFRDWFLMEWKSKMYWRQWDGHTKWTGDNGLVEVTTGLLVGNGLFGQRGSVKKKKKSLLRQKKSSF